MMVFPLTDEQRAAADAAGCEILVSAAAGSGKTRVLVERLLNMVCTGNKPRGIDEFLLITYTKAAAAEMRARVAEGMAARLEHDPGNRHIRRQLGLVSGADITTIHAFCNSLLKENAYLAGLSPDFRLIDDAEAEMLKTKALDKTLEKAYAGIGGGVGFALLAENLISGIDDRRIKQVLIETYNSLEAHAFPEKWAARAVAMYEAETADFANTEWGRIISREFRQAALHAKAALEAAARIAAEYEVLCKAYLPALEKDIDNIDIFLAALDREWDTILKAAKNLSFSPLGRAKGEKEAAEHIKKVRNAWKREWEKIKKACLISNSEIKEDITTLAPVVRALFELVDEFREIYAEQKQRLNACDFNDLEHFAAKLLLNETEDGRLEPTELAGEISARYTEILVDEYQDVNSVENAILGAISKNPGNLFLVGDIKQSIYRFRLADPSIFLRKYLTYRDYDEPGEGEPAKLFMTRNFRSRFAVLDAVNHVFSRVMKAESAELDYTGREKLNPGAQYPDEDFSTELHLLSMDDAYGDDEETPGKKKAEADFVAARIKELFASGMQISDGAGGKRLLNPGDIAILLRSTASSAHIYEKALADMGIRCSADRGGELLEAGEVMVLVSILEVVDNFSQDIPVISAMRSPLFAFSEEELAFIRAAHKDNFFHEAVRLEAEAGNLRCAEFVSAIEDLRLLAPDMPVHELIWHILSGMDLLSLYGSLPGGEERKRNLIRFHSFAKSYENSGYKGLFSFVSFLRRLRENGSGLKTSGGGAERDAVSVMSIHKSKGLEFPVVIVAGLNKQFNRQDATRQVMVHPHMGVGLYRRDLERMVEFDTLPRKALEIKILGENIAEEMRVLYVAMTRAREKLIMTGCVRDAGKYLANLAAKTIDGEITPRTIKTCNSMADWVWLAALSRPEAQGILPDLSFAVPVDDGTAKWIISVGGKRESGEQSGQSLPESEALEVQANAEDIEYIADALSFTYPYADAKDMPSKLTATQLKGRFLDDEIIEQTLNEPGSVTEIIKQPLKRPEFAMARKGLTAAERGTAVHLAMQHIDYTKCYAGGVEEELLRLRTGKYITAEQADAIEPEIIRAFFTSHLAERMMKSVKVEREFKFSILAESSLFGYKDGEKILFQGVIDCFFEEADGLVVLDYKTNVIKPGGETELAETYREQIESYSYALERITGRHVKERIIYFFATGEYCTV